MKRSNKLTGYTLHRGRNHVVIATLKSTNRKTGNMVQIWILPRWLSPLDAIRSGQDSTVCMDCKHRGQFDEWLDKWIGRSCYVNVARAPQGVWHAYTRGKYPYVAPRQYARVFAGRKIRLGAYGEPVLIPIWIVRALAAASAGWTGYTHQWRRPEYAAYREYLMASVDSLAEWQAAKAAGWRTFRVRGTGEQLQSREIVCPASDEAGHRTTCEQCRLCSGARTGDTRADIAIVIHGAGKANFVQIGGVA